MVPNKPSFLRGTPFGPLVFGFHVNLKQSTPSIEELEREKGILPPRKVILRHCFAVVFVGKETLLDPVDMAAVDFGSPIPLFIWFSWRFQDLAHGRPSGMPKNMFLRTCVIYFLKLFGLKSN